MYIFIVNNEAFLQFTYKRLISFTNTFICMFKKLLYYNLYFCIGFILHFIVNRNFLKS